MFRLRVVPCARIARRCGMIEAGKTYLVMGLLDPGSLAFAVGEAIRARGGKVIYTIQNEILKKRYLDTSGALSEEQRSTLEYRFCDVSDAGQLDSLFEGLGPLGGVVHSIAYANPKTCLGEELHTDALEDIVKSYQVSCASLAGVARRAVPLMPTGGAIVAMTFDSRRAFPMYNWMGVHKAALEALVRALARRHGRDLVRVNAVSAGPLTTTASSKIPGFEELLDVWQSSSPLPWDPEGDKSAVAEAVVFLLGSMARKITGQVLVVDGGVSIAGGWLTESERESKC
jgi:enoyl-[acyl-carrier protein] reductase I